MFWALLRQEVRALPRGRFGLLAAAVWLAIITLMTAFILGTEGNALYSILVVMYIIPSLAFLPITAGYVNSDRSTRFVQSVFTSPVRSSEYLLAKLAPPLVVAALYLSSTLPFFLVFAYHVGVPSLVGKFLLAATLLILVFVAMGGLIGILFVGRSTAAPIATATAFAAFSAAAVFFILLAMGMSPGIQRDVVLAIIHISPLVLVFDALELHGFVHVGSPLPSALALAAMGLFALGASLWIFTRQQAAESWEPTPMGRLLVPVLLALLLAVPAVGAQPAYGFAGSVNMVAARPNHNVTLLVAEPGDRLQDLGSGFQDPFPMTQDVAVDFLVLLPIDTPLPLQDVALTARGPNATITASSLALVQELERHPTDDGRTRDVLRIPGHLRLAGAESLGRVAIIIGFELSWRDSEGSHVEQGEQIVWAHKPGATGHLALAGLPSIALCLGSYGLRRWRLR